MERSAFFNAIHGDRRYRAEEFADYFATFIRNGVFIEPLDGLQVDYGGGMNLVIRPGKAWINGYYYSNTQNMVRTLPIATGSNGRIDRIVVRWDFEARRISVIVRQGTAATNPNPPALLRNSDFFELCLADVNVPAGVLNLPSGSIFDRRRDDELCGVVTSMVQAASERDALERIMGRPIWSGANLNLIDQVGIHFCETAAICNSLLNRPSDLTSRVFALEMFRSSADRFIQRITAHTTIASDRVMSWVRSRVNGTAWSPWVRLLDTGSAVPIVNGGTGSTTAAGALSALGGAQINHAQAAHYTGYAAPFSAKGAENCAK